jgi:hypothetical protein
MARIAAHHSPNHPLPSDEDYSLTLEWGDQVYVQWGRTQSKEAFFEAFTDGGIMIRTDEATLELAEAKAHELYTKEIACTHEWQRLNFTNGLGKCRHCKSVNTKAFKSIPKLGAFREPLNYYDLSFINGSGLRDRDFKERDNAKYKRTLTIKARLMGICLPLVPDARQTEDEFIGYAPESYNVRCREAISIWLHDTIEAGTNHLDPVYQKILSREISSSRATDNNLWSKLEKRKLLKSPVQTGAADTEIQMDEKTPFVICGNLTYKPSAGPGHFDNVGRVDRGRGGLMAGDFVAITQCPSVSVSDGRSNGIIVHLEDGRQLHWQRAD